MALFNGIGGFQLAAHWMGWENVCHVEIDPFCNKVVKQHFPNSICYEDIKTFDAREWRGKIDIISGGWPCQDNSNAKQIGVGQLGLSGARSGLYSEFIRIVREVQPRIVVGENVSNLLTINDGRDFNTILSDLAGMGYDVTWGVLRASDVGAPHHRERLYLVAYTGGVRSQTLHAIWKNAREKINRRKVSGLFDGASLSVGGAWGKVTPAILRMDDAVSNRVDRIKALGNAIVPQVAYEIFKALSLTQ